MPVFGGVLNGDGGVSGTAPPARLCRGFALRALGGALDEDAGDVVDGGPVDERFDKFRGCPEQGQ